MRSHRRVIYRGAAASLFRSRISRERGRSGEVFLFPPSGWQVEGAASPSTA